MGEAGGAVTMIVERSRAIRRSWANLDWPSLFSAVIYPALGVAALVGVIVAALIFSGVALHWWHAPIALGAGALTVFLCNLGIGPLHRIWQHRAGHLKWPAQALVAVNCILAMQGRLKDWVNYHAQHHRHADEPGDPHNPAEGKFWAWIGWVLWRDRDDLTRPTARWLEALPVVSFHDKHYVLLSLLLHLVLPAAIYLATWLAGGPLVLVAMLHAVVVIARGVHFHATTLGINVCGHIETPRWVTWLLAVLTGGEAFHEHHHDNPRSVLHLPRKGLLNRLVDYNGTMLLLLEKLRLARGLVVAPQFA